MGRTRRGAVALSLAAILMSAAPAVGGWLVLADGGGLETAGDWWIEDRLVLFHRPDGALASLALESVDLEASKEARGQNRLESSGLTADDGRRRANPVAAMTRDQSVEQLVRKWAAAWSAQDVDRYLDFYSGSFRPADGSSREDWARLRRRRLTAPRFIEVKISALRTEFKGRNHARAIFHQKYQSNTFGDFVTKTLELAREGTEWKIVDESLAKLVLTNADVSRRFVPASADEKAAAGATASPLDDGQSVEVVDWGTVFDRDFDGVKIAGTLRNTSKVLALNMVLTVRLLADEGMPVGRTRGRLGTTALQPGASTGFEASFAGVHEYKSVQFDVQSFDAVLRGGFTAEDPLPDEIH